jgi:hypothetical protein
LVRAKSRAKSDKGIKAGFVARIGKQAFFSGSRRGGHPIA